MKKSTLLAYAFGVAIIFFSSAVKAQNNISLLRYEDHFQHLKKDSLRKGLDRLKYIPLCRNNYVSFGAEWREQLQVFRNANFGDVPPGFSTPHPTQWSHRLMLHADLALSHQVRVFVQLNNTLRFLNHNPLVPEIDENQLSLHQAFVELAHKSFRIRLGRQELFYGAHRLITVREGPNTRKTFDGLVIKKRLKNGHIDVLALSPVIARPKVFDDTSFKEWVLGFYGSRPLAGQKMGLDFFALHFQSRLRKYNYQPGFERRQTYGLRLFTNLNYVNFEAEAMYQAGKFNGLSIEAYSLLLDLNATFLPARKGIVGISAGMASGDKNPDDAKLNTYNLLFAKPAFGLAIPVGATNMASIYPYLKINPIQQLNLLAQVFFLARKSERDGIYSPGMIENRPRPEELFSSRKKTLGIFYVLETSYQQSAHLSFGLDVSWFNAGSFPKATGKGRDIGYWSFRGVWRF